jgi:predicted ATPase
MYINKIEIENFRTFRKSHIDFIHPQQDFKGLGLPIPRLRNVNLLLGNNGLGKTTLLKAISLAALGPAVRSSGIYAYRLVRREPNTSESASVARIEAEFIPHDQDQVDYSRIESRLEIVRKGDLEELQWTHPEEKRWHPIFSTSSDAFFFVGYGATRRVEKRDQVDIGSRRSNSFVRAQRVQSLFEEAYSLLPLNSWLPQFQHENPGRYKQVITLISRLMGEGHYEFTGEMEEGEYVFNRSGLKVPFTALSDGYRAFIGWVGDLLYHVCMTASKGEMLWGNKGIVMVDEIDLHLHPKWQMTILQTLSEALPNIQFIVTSHSPLIVGSLEWMNIIVMLPEPGEASETQRIEWAVHGLDADQVLLTDFFGMESTRAPGKKRRLKELSLRARDGDTEAAKTLLTEMSGGTEVEL